METGECVKTLVGHTDIVNSAVYSWDNKKILSASWDDTIKEWDVETGECVKTLVGHSDNVTSAVYSRDNKKILSASYDQTTKEWDVETGECLHTWKKHEKPQLDEYEPGENEDIKLPTYGNTIEFKGKELVNIPGLFIQGCGFKDLDPGSCISSENLEILKQYGARFK